MDWTASARIKVERAKEHIADLEAKNLAFKQTGPYEIVTNREPDSGDLVYRFRMHASPPVAWGAIVGDAIHNLRSALDVLISQRIFHVTGVEPGSDVYFPIAKDSDSFEANHLPKVQGAGHEAVDLLKAIKPYKGGNEGLWALHRLSIIDKHYVLTPVVAAIKSLTMNAMAGLKRRAVVTPTDPEIRSLMLRTPDLFISLSHDKASSYPLKDGAELYRIDGKGLLDMDVNPQFTITIAFGECEPVKGEPVLPTLRQLKDLVEGIVTQFSRL